MADITNEIVKKMRDYENRIERLEKIEQPRGANYTWASIAAASITATAGGIGAGVVADLRTAHDGLYIHVDEVAATPGLNFIVDFTGVTEFSLVHIIGTYDGSATHSIGIQLYYWVGTTWHTWDSMQTGQEDTTTAGGYILDSHDFTVPSSAPYIGTGADAGKVRVRFYHTMGGNASHDLWLDIVELVSLGW